MRARLLKRKVFKNISKKRTTKVLLPFFLLMFSLAFVSMPNVAFASWWNPADWVWNILAGILKLAATALYFWGFLYVKIGIFFTNFLVGSPAVAENWRKVRDLSLGIFGLTIIIIAVMNILRVKIEEWGVNRMIPRLALAAIAVLFSKYICLTVLNFSNSIANAITTAFNFNIYEPFDLLGNMFGTFCQDCDGQVNFISSLMLLIVAVVAWVFLIILGIILILRALFLAFLVIVSPLAFALNIIPWTVGGFKKWWDMFIKWTFFYPIALLILAIGISVSIGSQKVGYDPLRGLIHATIGGIGIFDTAAEQVSMLFTQFAFALIALVTIPIAIFAPLKLLGAAGGMISNAIKKAGRPFGEMATGKRGIPGLKYDPKAFRTAGKQMLDESGKRKALRAGNLFRKGFEGKLGEKFPRMAGIARSQQDMARDALVGDVSKIKTDKTLANLFGKAMSDPKNMYKRGKVEQYAREQAAKNPGITRQHQKLKDLEATYGSRNACLAVAGDLREKGWLSGDTLADQRFKEVCKEEGFNPLGSSEQAKKRRDYIDNNINSYTAQAVQDLHADAFNFQGGYSQLSVTELANADESTITEFASSNRMSTEKKGQLAGAYDYTKEHFNKLAKQANATNDTGAQTYYEELAAKSAKHASTLRGDHQGGGQGSARTPTGTPP